MFFRRDRHANRCRTRSVTKATERQSMRDNPRDSCRFPCSRLDVMCACACAQRRLFFFFDFSSQAHRPGNSVDFFPCRSRSLYVHKKTRSNTADARPNDDSAHVQSTRRVTSQSRSTSGCCCRCRARDAFVSSRKRESIDFRIELISPIDKSRQPRNKEEGQRKREMERERKRETWQWRSLSVDIRFHSRLTRR
jgi:hypothetical protein